MTFCEGRPPVLLPLLGFCCWICASPGTAAATAQIGQNFTGSTYGTDSEASPADGNGAAGPQHFVEFVNGRFSVYEKATGKRVQSMTDLRFWNIAGITFSSTVGVTDPRILFDVYSQRWFASMVDFTVNRPSQRSNHFLLAVSQSADPTGKWNAFSFATDTNRVNFADFPTLGIDPNAVYMSGDMFDRLGNPVGPSLITIPTKDLLSDPPTVAGLKYLGTLSYTSRGSVLQPAVTIGAPTTPEIVVAVGDRGVDFNTGGPNGPHTTLFLSTVLSGGATNAVLFSPSTVLDVPSYSVPINPPQPDGTDNLDNGDARFGSCARRVGDVVYVTHAIEVNDRAVVRWYKINATTGSLIQADTITDPALDLFYPSIAANEAGTVVIGCNGSSATTFVGSYAAVGQTVNGTLTFGTLTLLKSGTASYQNPDISGTSRWGDYSATSLDPADANRFWTIQMIPVSTSAWATQITEIITGNGASGGISLTATRSGSNMIVSWPTAASGSELQSASSLSTPTQWVPVAQAPTVEGATNSVLLPVSTNQQFFRLTSPAPPASSGG